jgi:hypothetical protein
MSLNIFRFHFRHAWDYVMASMNLKRVETVVYGAAYLKTRDVNATMARCVEAMSKRLHSQLFRELEQSDLSLVRDERHFELTLIICTSRDSHFKLEDLDASELDGGATYLHECLGPGCASGESSGLL